MPHRPDCPYCHRPMSFNGTQISGAEVYRCRRGCLTSEGKTVTKTISNRPAHRPKSGNAKSQKELTARWKENDPEGYRAAMKRKQDRRKAKRKELKVS
jgi:hypothetical protein